ncbi:hypothetical protein ACFFTM_01485 [Pseudoduganella plicata]|nr:hypothetical protein GCM10007388_02040 [Pseudoduganella plicata]
MDGFSDTDWAKLRGVCATKGTAWQIRCAEMLDGTVNSAALEILTSLMASRNRDVVMAAAETLLSLAQTGTSVEVTPQLSALISKARMNGGDPYGFVLDLLLKNSKT